MRTVLTLAAIAMASSRAVAQDADYSKLQVYHAATAGKVPCPCGEKGWNGSRLEITLRNLNTLKGFLIDPDHDARARVKPRKIDFTQVKSLTLDISLEYVNLNGSILIPKTDIKSIRVLEHLDETAIKRLELEKEKNRLEIERLNREHDARMKGIETDEEKAKAEAEKEASAEAEKESIDEAAAKLKTAVDAYNKFPESEGWGPEKSVEISNKVKQLQQVTPQEQEFLQNYASWITGKQYSDSKKKKPGD